MAGSSDAPDRRSAPARRCIKAAQPLVHHYQQTPREPCPPRLRQGRSHLCPLGGRLPVQSSPCLVQLPIGRAQDAQGSGTLAAIGGSEDGPKEGGARSGPTTGSARCAARSAWRSWRRRFPGFPPTRIAICSSAFVSRADHRPHDGFLRPHRLDRRLLAPCLHPGELWRHRHNSTTNLSRLHPCRAS